MSCTARVSVVCLRMLFRFMQEKHFVILKSRSVMISSYGGAHLMVFSQPKFASNPFRRVLPNPLGHDVVWKIGMLPKISVFMWRLFHNALPTEDNVRRCGVHLASMCKCCSHSRSIESKHHLFFQGEWAVAF